MQGLRVRAWFLRSPGFCCSSSSKPFHKDIPGLNSFECLFTAPKAGVSQAATGHTAPAVPNSKAQTTVLLHPSLWKVGSGGQGVLCPSHQVFDIDPS